jgi:hypothetical protein
MCPRSKVEGNQRLVLTHATTYEEALLVIYETLDCTTVPKKPELSYKLSTVAARAANIALCSAADWEGLLDEVAAAEKKKATTVNIIVSDQVSGISRTEFHLISAVSRVSPRQAWRQKCWTEAQGQG